MPCGVTKSNHWRKGRDQHECRGNGRETHALLFLLQTQKNRFWQDGVASDTLLARSSHLNFDMCDTPCFLVIKALNTTVWEESSSGVSNIPALQGEKGRQLLPWSKRPIAWKNSQAGPCVTARKLLNVSSSSAPLALGLGKGRWGWEAHRPEGCGEHRAGGGQGTRGEKAGSSAPGEAALGDKLSLMGRQSPTFPRFITSRKSVRKKEQITAPVSFDLNIDGPPKVQNHFRRRCRVGRKGYCEALRKWREDKQYSFNATATISVVWALISRILLTLRHLLLNFLKKKKICFGQNTLSYSISQ